MCQSLVDGKPPISVKSSSEGTVGSDCGQEISQSSADLVNAMYEATQNIVEQPPNIQAVPKLSKSNRNRLIETVDSWAFEPQKLPDEEVLCCTIIVFEALWRIDGMREAMANYGVTFEIVTNLLAHLQSLYQYHSLHSHHRTQQKFSESHILQNPYHNFAHALDVLQASYAFLKGAGIVPSVCILLNDQVEGSPPKMWSRSPTTTRQGPTEKLDLLDIFIIHIAAVGHDVGHPGFGNGFMKNASSPLGILYSQTSPLESMHTMILLQALRFHGLGALLDSATTLNSTVDGNCHASLSASKEGKTVQSYPRTLITQMVMSTDMCVHDDWVLGWKGQFSDPSIASSPEVTCDILWNEKVLVCQAILKCADICNPTRPFEITVKWSSALMHEWISQARLEHLLNLPATALSKATPLAEAQSQVGFMKRFALPLFELVSESVISSMAFYTEACRANLILWEHRKATLAAETIIASDEAVAQAKMEEERQELRDLIPRLPADYCGVFKLCLPPGLLSAAALSDHQSDRHSEELDRQSGSATTSDSATSECDDLTTISTSTAPSSPVSHASGLTSPSSPATSDSTSSLFSLDSLSGGSRPLSSSSATSSQSAGIPGVKQKPEKLRMSTFPAATSDGKLKKLSTAGSFWKTPAWANKQSSPSSSSSSPAATSSLPLNITPRPKGKSNVRKPPGTLSVQPSGLPRPSPASTSPSAASSKTTLKPTSKSSSSSSSSPSSPKQASKGSTKTIIIPTPTPTRRSRTMRS
ncbi:hypothetical protein C8J56DRAFT_915693 [Mycena floridula]|nr:hypothetical protein C8J56DRAFT_915693 [Mycena floridula]